MDAPETILIIDPDERRRTFARDVLDRAGYDVRVAANETEAADPLDEWRPAAVVAPVPPNLGAVASYPVVVTATPGTPEPEDPHVTTVVAAPFDRADLLAAVWVALNP